MLLCVQSPPALLPGQPAGVLPLPSLAADVLGHGERRDGGSRPCDPRAEARPASPSPSTPLPCCLQSAPPLWDPTEDLRCIATTFRYLDSSGWYWGALTASEARQQLQPVEEGTFLVRDSSHPLYMLTLSVKTHRGPTNVRIEYSHGLFRLDSSCLAKPRILAFPDVLSLVRHYVGSCRAAEGEEGAAGPALLPQPKDSAVLLKLVRPLHRRDAFPSLQHLSRLAINRLTASPDRLPLPRRLQHFLQEYPFPL
ncbi:cytokine-inducible SH2-containing protein [Lepisosteus oculatus]|uniref:cytokine-inducible SH2-containing protein n=1 Tax=Lepisosteus oculatus TaxID=7918 RepID=UPI00371E2B21